MVKKTIIKKLENDMTCILSKTQCANTKRSAIIVMVKVGSIHEDEDNGEIGMAHFLEHVILNGTSRRKNYYEIFNEIDKMGGEMNAHTTKDRTVFHITFPDMYFDQAMDILSDCLFHTVITNEKIEKEKSIVIEEENNIKNDLIDMTDNKLDNLMFKVHPLGRDPIGDKKSTMNFTLDGTRRFKNKFYRPDNMIVSVCSKLSYNKVYKCIDKYFGKYKNPNKKLCIKFPTEVLQKTPRIAIFKEYSRQYTLGVGFKTFGIEHEDIYILDVFNTLMGGIYGSILFMDLREKNELVYSVDSNIDLRKDYGTFTVYIEVDKENFYEVLERIVSIIRRIQKEGIDKKKFNDVKKTIKRNILNKEEEVLDEALTNATNYLYFNHLITDREKINRYKKVSLADIKKLVNEIFNLNTINIVSFGDVSERKIRSILGVY